MTPPDILCLVGSVSPWHHEELRYSLRSLCQYLPHRKMVVVGHAPGWLTGAEHIWCEDRHHMPVRNTLRKLQLAVESGLLASSGFVLWNDDFYLLRRWHADAPALADGTLRQRVAQRGFATPDHEQLLAHTLKMLEAAGFPDALNHDVHRPLTMHPGKVLEMLDRFGRASVRNVYAWRSAYAALHGIPSELAPNTKQRGHFLPPGEDADLFSASDAVVRQAEFQAWCGVRWPVASPYEAA